MSIRKNSCFILYAMVSPEEPLEVTSGLRVSVHPAPLIRLLHKKLPKSYVFSAHRIFKTFCAPFSNRIIHFPQTFGLIPVVL